MVFNNFSMKWFTYLVFLCNTLVFSQEDEKKFSLFFENDQYELSPIHYQLIDSLKSLENKSLYDVHINGFTNSIGDSVYNLQLSQKRAESVKKELRSFTIISSTGYGELKSEAANNRRVDVFIHLKEDHVAKVGEIIEEPLIVKSKQNFNNLVLPKIGDKIILEGIMFYQDRDVIMDESKEALEELVVYLNENPNVKFKLLGHICCGDKTEPYQDVINVRTGKKNLSEARAKSLYNYLLKNGIDKSRMRYKGMAFRNPTGKGSDFDRRVEIEITSVD